MAANPRDPKLDQTIKGYKQFLEVFKLSNSQESFQAFQTYVNARQTNKRAQAARPEGEGLGNFRTSTLTLVNGKPDDTRYGKSMNSYVEASFGTGDKKQLFRAPFWATSVSYGYGSSGQTAQSRFFSAYYANALTQSPLSVKGRLQSDDGVGQFSEFIRAAQLQMVLGRGLMRVVIPGAAINCGGFIPSFSTDFRAGFEPAPEISFDFIVVNDTGDISPNNHYSQQVLAYYLSPEDKFWTGREAGSYTVELREEIERELLRRISRRVKDKREVREMMPDIEALVGGLV